MNSNQTNNTKDNKNQSSTIEEIDIKALLLTLLKNWYVFVIAGFVCLSVAVFYLLSTPPEYATNATILVRSEGKGLGGSLAGAAAGIAGDMFSISKAVDDEIVIAKSNTLISDLVKELSLQTQVFYKKRLGGAYELYNNEPLVIIYPDGYLDSMNGSLTIDVKKTDKGVWKFKFKHRHMGAKTKFKTETSDLSQALKTPWGIFMFIENSANIDPKYPDYHLVFSAVTHKQRVEDYKKNISVELSTKKSNAFNIRYVGNNSNKNEAIVNKIIELYTRDASNDKFKASMQMSSFISERIESIGKELAEVETRVEKFRTENNIANLKEQSSIALKAITDYERSITEIDMQYSLMNFIEDYISKSEQFDLIPSNTGVSDESLAKLIIDYNNQLLEYRRLTRSTNEANPVISQLKDKILLTRGMILETITNIKDGMEIRRRDIVKKSNEINNEIYQVPTVERQYIEIGREQTIKQQLYLFLLQKREEAQMSLSSATSDSKIVDQAYTDLKKVSPRGLLILVFALFCAALFGCAYILIHSMIHTEITGLKQLQSLTDLPIIATIPAAQDPKGIIIGNNRCATAINSLDLIRSNMKFLLRGFDKVIAITSTQTGEGKSFIASNLAMTLATDKNVAIVGLDFRHPALAEKFSIAKTPGITDYLVDENLIWEDIRRTYRPGLDIFVAGTVPPNPAELLASPRLTELINCLRERYDYVLFDSAPISQAAEIKILATMADATVCVCRQKVTKAAGIDTLNTLVKDDTLNKVSIILNCSSDHKLS